MGLLILRTIPLVLVASLLAAVLATTRRVQERLLKKRWGNTELIVVWGIAVLVLTVVAITLSSANEYYQYGIGPKSILPSATIADLESRRTGVLVEYSLRIYLGRDRYDYTCHTTEKICALVNGVMIQAARQSLDTGIGTGRGQVINIIGLATAISADLLFAVVLLLRKKSKIDGQEEQAKPSTNTT